MRKRMGLFVSIALLAAFLAGCTGTPSENGSTGQTTQNSSSGTPETTEEDTIETESESAWPRTITDLGGNEVEIAKEPQRIAVIHFSDMEYMLALEAPLIAAGWADDFISEWDTLEPYRGKGIVDLGSPLEPNLEQLLELEPDLIIASAEYSDQMHDDLQKIAPTVFLGEYESWEDRLRATAEVVGKEEKAESYIVEVHQSIESAREKLAKYGDQTFGSIRADGDLKTMSAYGVGILDAYYEQEKGLALREPEDNPESWAEINLEGIAALNPDYILIHSDSKTNYDAHIAAASEQSVWNNLEAVKNDRLIYINTSALSGSPRAIEAAIQNILAGVEQ